MDNFRKLRKKRAPAASVDGFVAGKSVSPINGRSRSKIGNFDQADGFNAKQQSSMGFGDVTKRRSGRQPQRDAQGRIQLAGEDSPKLKKRRNWRLIVKRSAIALFAVALIGTGYISINGYLKARHILAGGGGAPSLDENVDPTKLNGEGDGRVNILMLGKGGDGHTAPDLTDTILVASIDPIHKEAAVLSIPRDLWVKNPGGGYSKINAVYATAKSKVLSGKKIDNQKQKAEDAGLAAIEQVIETDFGLPIHYHAMVDFSGFKQAIDAVGGVDIRVTSSVYEVMSIDGRKYTLNVQPGQQHFDGFRALAYSRSRYTSSRGDFDRAERQRLILMGLKDKVFSLGTFSNPLKINELINAFGSHISSNMKIDELMRLYDIGKQIDGSKVESIGLADPPNNFVKTGNIGGQSVVVPTAGVDNFKEIQSYLHNKLRDGFLRKEDAAIGVYNGTSVTGLAARTADDLKSYGYNITAVADSPNKGNKDTILVDLRGGQKKYTLHYLEQRLKVTAVTQLPANSGITPGTADFVIILGTNEVTRLQD